MEQAVTAGEIAVRPMDLLRALLKKSWIAALCALLCAGVGFLGTLFLSAPQYQSSVIFYINNDTGSDSISSSDISASKGLMDSCIAILNTRTTLEEVANRAGIGHDWLRLRDMLHARNPENTVLLEVTVTATDAREAYALALTVAEVLPERVVQAFKGVAAEVVDAPVAAAQPTGPDYLKNTVLAYAIGLTLSAAAILAWQIWSDTKRVSGE